MITEKMKKFCEYFVKNYNGAEAYRLAYGQEDNIVAKQGANDLLKDRRIVDYIEQVEGEYRILGYKLGIDKKAILTKLKEMLNSKKPVYYQGAVVGDMVDSVSVAKAIEILVKLMGDFAPEKKELYIDEEVNIEKLTPDERNKLKEKLLREL